MIGSPSMHVRVTVNRSSLWYLRHSGISGKSLKELSRHSVLDATRIKPLEFFEQCTLGNATRRNLVLLYIELRVSWITSTKTYGTHSNHMEVLGTFSNWLMIYQGNSEFMC